MGAKLNKNVKTPEEREAFNKWAIMVGASSLYTEYDENYDVRQHIARKEEYEHALFLQEKEEELAKKKSEDLDNMRFKLGFTEPEDSTDQGYSVANTIKNYFYKILK
jgi:hypothetical protein